MHRLKKECGITMVGSNYNNKRYLFAILVLLISNIGCNDRQPKLYSKAMIFNRYDKEDSLIKSELFKVNIFALNNGVDSINVISNNAIYFSFKQIEDSSGIYRFCKENTIKTHSFLDTLITEYCISKPPFLNENVSYRGNKIFSINDKNFKIYHFIENTGNHTSYDSYYLQDVGFICYYSFDKDEYILCDSLKGYQIKSEEMKQISNALVTDTTFFSRYILRKLYPNYHRTPISSKIF